LCHAVTRGAGVRSLATVSRASRTNVPQNIVATNSRMRRYCMISHTSLFIHSTYSLKRRALSMHAAATVCARRRTGCETRRRHRRRSALTRSTSLWCAGIGMAAAARV
jgi:hypothetical protein